ncbi:MAG TPA: hypothetical protein VJN64_11710 [Terriglobales bacterium]|nr:hypothetical protein [Terriglobales bacterium]
MIHALQSPSSDLIATLLIQLAGVCFSAGVFAATVVFLSRKVKELETDIDKGESRDDEQDRVLTEHGEDIQGLKVHTHYHG